MRAKKILSVIIAIAMIMSTMGTVAFAADVLPDADNSIIVLTEDVVLTSTLEISEDVTIDLAGYKITSPDVSGSEKAFNPLIRITGATVTIMDSADTKGAIVPGVKDDPSSYNTTVRTLEIANADVTIDGAVIKGQYGINTKWGGEAINAYLSTLKIINGAEVVGGDIEKKDQDKDAEANNIGNYRYQGYAGAAVVSYGSDVTVADSKVTGGSGTASGTTSPYGIGSGRSQAEADVAIETRGYNGTNSNLTITDSIIKGGDSFNYKSGSALSIQGSTKATITGSTIAGGRTTDTSANYGSGGAGVYFSGTPEVTIKDCEVSAGYGNSSVRYGALEVGSSDVAAKVVVEDTTIDGGDVYAIGGSGFKKLSQFTLVDSTIKGGQNLIESGNLTSIMVEGTLTIADDSENKTLGDTPIYTTGGAVVNGADDVASDGAKTVVAKVGTEYYEDIKSALAGMSAENNTLDILSDITVDYKWDCRNGAKFTYPVVINGNGHTLKFTGEINDGYNHLAVFRPEAEATFMNLTVDMSEAIAAFQNRFTVISSKDANLTVTDCTFIGNESATNARAIIFGETAEHNDAEVVVSGCTFTNFRYGVTDNLNGKDVGSVKVINSEFANASINVSASEEVTITGNEIDGGYVKVASYTQSPEQNLIVTVKENVLDEDFAEQNAITAGTIIDAQDGFILPVAEVNGKKYMTLSSAVKNATDGDVVYLTPGTYTDELVINKAITITGDPNYGTAARAAIEKPVIVISDVTNGGTEYNAANVTFDNLVFKVAEDATGAGWNVSALGYYYENTADRNGLVVTNCDFINDSDISLGAIAANIGKYTIKNNTFTNFTTGVWSYVDHGAADEIIVSDNTFENVANLVSIYHGAAADGTANVTIANNKATDESTTQISVTDFGQTKDTPATAYNNVVITDNDAEIVLGNYAESSFNDTVEGNDAIIYNYASEAVLRALETAGVPAGDVYVNYGSDHEVMYKVIDGTVYAAADALEVEFELASETEDEKIYNINLKANAQGIINRLNSADLTFLFSQVEGANEYEIIASNSEVAINPVNNSKARYEFHYNGKDNVLTDTDTIITIGQVKFTGYGKFSFAVDSAATTNAAHSTTMMDNIVDTFVPGGVLEDGTAVGVFDVTDDTIKDVVIAAPTRTLTITIDFPNAIKANVAAYQEMKVEITGVIDGVNQTVEYDLGETMDNGSYVVENSKLVLNNAYTVTVSGEGYRTTRYTVTMTTDKKLRFWNNVMDEAQVVEIGKGSSEAYVTFLAGDIVKDNVINIYDLSAVVSYFGTTTVTSEKSEYVKYDLNRDGVIDSKDVAYILVSWGK